MATQPTKPTVRIEQVTPELADKYLGTMTQNRVLRDNRVMQWVTIITEGEWKLTNDAISFDTNGHLINGQHRLAAIVVAEIAVPLIVVRGLPVDVQDVMDSGLTRKLSDALQLRGETDCFVKASALRWIARLDYIEAEDGATVNYYRNNSGPSVSQLLHLFDRQAEAIAEVLPTSRRAKATLGLPAGVIAVMVRQRELDPEDFEAFWAGAVDGVGLESGDGRLALRNYLLSPTRSGTRRLDYLQLAYVTKAWNHWRDGNPVHNLKWNFGGAHSERFPIPH